MRKAHSNGEWYRPTDWVFWALHTLEILPIVGLVPGIPEALVNFRGNREDWSLSADSELTTNDY
jgi:hypothetical protein